MIYVNKRHTIKFLMQRCDEFLKTNVIYINPHIVIAIINKGIKINRNQKLLSMHKCI